MGDKKKLQNRDGARVAGGLIIVAVGTALLLRNIGYDLPYWLFKWPMILILVGIYSGIKHSFRNAAWLILIAIGGFFLLDDFIPNLKLEPAFWPIIIIVIGVLFILRPRRKKLFDRTYRSEVENEVNTFTNENKAFTADDPLYEKMETIKIDAVFSGIDRTVLSKNLKGGRISCVFGGADIDFLHANINGQVLIKMDVIFGGVKLVVPAHWTVQSQVDGAFHTVDDKRKHASGVTTDPNKVLVIKGSCVFGGIEIKSY